MSVDHVTRRSVHDDALDPADLIERGIKRDLLRMRMLSEIGWVGYELSGVNITLTDDARSPALRWVRFSP
jgi:hypothetical protein